MSATSELGLPVPELPAIAGMSPETAARAAHEALVASSAETAAHSDDVDLIAEGICRILGVDGSECHDLQMAARLHDIGKVAIPASILQKPGPLDAAEWDVIRTHTEIGDRILRSVPSLSSYAHIVRHSHERWDGGGYPDGLAGEEIPLGSRIIFCADSFHAIRSDRVYRKGRSPAAALREVRAGAGTQFDPEVVAALVELRRDLRSGMPYAGLNNRSGRLMALMLIVSCGAGGAALAHSGLFGESSAEAEASPQGLSRQAPPQSPAALASPRLRLAPAVGICGPRGCRAPSERYAADASPAGARESGKHLPLAARHGTGAGDPVSAGGSGSAGGSVGPHEAHPGGHPGSGGHSEIGGGHSGSGGGHHGSGPHPGSEPAHQGGFGTLSPGPGSAPAPGATAPGGHAEGSAGGGQSGAGGDETGGGDEHGGGGRDGHSEEHGNGNAYGHTGGLGNPDPGSGGNAYGHTGGKGHGNPHLPPMPTAPAVPPLPLPSIPGNGHGNGNGNGK